MLFSSVVVVFRLFNFATFSEGQLDMSAASCSLLIVRFSICVLEADFGCIKAVHEFVDRWCGQLYTGTTEILVFFCLKENYLSSAQLCES
jgi:hypothetical protein